MFVSNFRVERSRQAHKFMATVHWEDRRHDPVDLYYAVDELDAPRVDLNPDAFRVPAAIVALHDDERRLGGGGPICPVLHDGLRNSFAWLRRWARSDEPTPEIDAPVGCSHPRPGATASAAAFLSGGVDSMALVVHNQAGDPPPQERVFSVGLVVVGIQKHRWGNLSEISEQLDAARRHLAPVGRLTGLTIVPIATNIRDLHPQTRFWQYEFQGAALAGIAHLFAPSLASASIASTWRISHLGMWGSHPVLDTNYGTDSLSIRHELAHLSRLDKLRIISEHPALLERLNVCNRRTDDASNCGRCEKCIRTMLGLESMRLLNETEAFGQRSLTPRDLRAVHIKDRGLEAEYVELVEPLRAIGRKDLADAVKKQVLLGRFRRNLSGRFGHAWRSRKGVTRPALST